MILEKRGIGHIGDIRRKIVRQEDVRHGQAAEIVEDDGVLHDVAGAQEPVAVVIGLQRAVLAGIVEGQRRNGGADVQPRRGGAGGQGILPPGGGEFHAVGQRINQHAGLVAIRGIVDFPDIQFPQGDRGVVLVPVGIGQGAGQGIGVVVNVDGRGGVAVADGGDPDRVAVLVGIGGRSGIAADAEPDQHLRGQRALRYEGEAPIPCAAAAGIIGGGIGGGQRVEGRAGGGVETGAIAVGNDLFQIAAVRAAGHGERRGCERIAAGAGPRLILHRDGGRGRVIEPDRGAGGAGGCRNRRVIAAGPQGARHQAVKIALELIADVARDEIHLHRLAGGDPRTHVDVAVGQIGLSFPEGDGCLIDPIRVRVDLHDRTRLSGHDGEAHILELVVVKTGWHVRADRNPVRCTPAGGVEDLVRPGQQGVGARGPAGARDGDALRRGDLVAAVKINRLYVGGGDRIVQDEHRPRVDHVGGNSRRRAVGGIAVAPDLSSARIAGAVKIGRIGNVGIEPVFPLVIVDDGAVGHRGYGDIGLHRIGAGRPGGVDGLHRLQDLGLRDRDVERLHRHRIIGADHARPRRRRGQERHGLAPRRNRRSQNSIAARRVHRGHVRCHMFPQEKMATPITSGEYTRCPGKRKMSPWGSEAHRGQSLHCRIFPCGGPHPMRFWRISATSLGLAFPRLNFMTWPMRCCRAAALPPR